MLVSPAALTIPFCLLYFTVLIAPAAAQTCTAAPEGLMHWWPGDGEANDASGANYGVLRNGAAYASGKVGQAFSFDGVDDYIALAPIQFPSSPASAWSIEGWIYLESLEGCDKSNRIVVDVAGSGIDGLLVSADCRDGKLYAMWGKNISRENALAKDPNPLPFNQWVHFAATHDGSTGRLYVNGSLVASTEALSFVQTPVSTQGAYSYLGNRREGPNRISFWQGRLDEIGIYNRALNESNVQAIFKSDSAGKCKPPSDASPAVIRYLANADPTTVDGYLSIPAAQPWSRKTFHTPRSQPLLDPVAVGTIPAWEANTLGLMDHEEFWVIIPKTEDVTAGNNSGWTLTTRLRLPTTGDSSGPGVTVDYADGSKLWQMQFGTNVDGDPIVALAGEPSPSLTLDGAGNAGYHTYTLKYDAAAGTVDLFVDGVERVSNHPGLACGPCTPSGHGLGNTRVGFGDMAYGDDGHGRYQFVEWTVARQSTTTEACVPAPEGLMHWWPGDGEANDAAGTNYGVLKNGAAYASGKVGQAFSLDGVDDYIALAPIQFPSSPARTWTIEGWINLETLADCNTSDRIEKSDRMIIDVASSGIDGLLVSADCRDGKLYAMWGTNTPVNSAAKDPKPLPLNQWVHFAATHDGSTGRLYVNGSLVASSDAVSFVQTPVNSGGSHSSLGNMYWGPNWIRFWKGRLDELAIYDRALSGAEVQTIFNAHGAGKCKLPQPRTAAVIRYLANEDPTTVDGYLTVSGDQPWSLKTFSTPRSQPLFDPTGVGMTPVWDVNTIGLMDHEEFWVITPRAEDITTASTHGWTLTARLRLPAVSLASGAVDYMDGSKQWQMRFWTDADGDPVVALAGETNPSFTLEGAGSTGYHTYSLKYDPVGRTADLLVDGVERISNHAGLECGPCSPSGHGLGDTRVGFGDMTSSYDGHARYQLIEWTVARPAARDEIEPLLTCIEPHEIGFTAVWGYRNKSGKTVRDRAGNDHNWMSPGEPAQGQPSIFEPGGPRSLPKHSVFATEVMGDSATWHLGAASATASANGRLCSSLAEDDCEAGDVKIDGICQPAPMTVNSLQRNEVSTQVSGDGRSPYATAGTFAVSDDGAATYQLPIWLPPMILAPTLTIDYNSRSGNGPLGVGWALKGDVISEITRCAQSVAQTEVARAVRFDAQDAFCLDGNRLILYEGIHGADGATYFTERHIFARIRSLSPDDNGPTQFEVQTKDGRTLIYRDVLNNSLRIQNAGTTVLVTAVRSSWQLVEVRDRAGNKLSISYRATRGDIWNNSANEIYFDQISYTSVQHSTPTRIITFKYKTRTDPVSFFVGGVERRTSQLLSEIEISAGRPRSLALVRRYVLSYDTLTMSLSARPAKASRDGGLPRESVLASVEECDRGNICSRPARFDYSRRQGLLFSKLAQPIFTYRSNRQIVDVDHRVADLNGDGLLDLLYLRANTTTRLINWFYRLNQGGGRFDPERQVETPTGFRADGSIWMYYIQGQGPQHSVTVAFKGPSSRGFDTVDFNSDGAADVVGAWTYKRACADNHVGSVLYERWESFFRNDPATGQFRSFVNRTFNIPHGDDAEDKIGAIHCGATKDFPVISRVADLNGDGFPDFLRTRVTTIGPNNQQARWFIRVNALGDDPPSDAFLPAAFLAPDVSERFENKSDPKTITIGLPLLASDSDLQELIDLDGDGAVELLRAVPSLGGRGRRGETEGREYTAFFFSGLRMKGHKANASSGTMAPLHSPTGLNTTFVRRGNNGDKIMDALPIIWADLNGDGLKDAIRQPECGGNPEVQINRGGSFALPIRIELPAEAQLGQRRTVCDWSNTDDLRTAPLVMDVDLDGKEELVLLDTGIVNSTSSSRKNGARQFVTVLFWNGSGFSYSKSRIPAVRDPYARHINADITGDGIDDLIVERGGNLELWMAGQISFQPAPAKPGLLTKVTDGWGVVTTITHSNIADPKMHSRDRCTDDLEPFGRLCLKKGVWVVSKHDIAYTSDTRHFTHHYWGARTDVGGRGWLGFRKVSHRDVEGKRTTEREFDLAPFLLGDGPGTNGMDWPETRVYPNLGQPMLETTIVDVDDTRSLTTLRETKHNIVWRRAATDSGAGSGPYYWTFPERVSVRESEELWSGSPDQESPRRLLSRSILRQSLTVQNYETADSFGKLNSSETVISDAAVDLGEDIGGVAGERLKHTYTYKPDDRTRWLIAKVDTETREITGTDGGVERHVQSYDYHPETGLLRRVVSEPGRGPTLELTTDIDRYPHGLSKKVTVTAANKPARTANYFYDAFGGGTLSAKTNPEGHTEYYVYSPRLGALLGAADANGVTTLWEVDGFGLPRAEIRGPAVKTDISSSWNTNTSRLTVRQTESAGSWQEEEIDNRGFTVTRRQPKHGGGIVSETIGYDTVLGLPKTHMVPGDQVTSTLSETWSYDRAGRLTGYDADSASTLYIYNKRTVEIVRQPRRRPSPERRTFIEKDPLGRIALVKELGRNSRWLATEYKYHAGGRLKEVYVGPEGTTKLKESITYEGDTGRRESITTSSSGISKFTWNAFGELEKEQRAKDASAGAAERQTTQFAYDSLGRRTKMVVDGETAIWQWDESPRGVGRLPSATSLDGVATSYAYTRRGRLAGVLWSHEQDHYLTTFAHDSHGRLRGIKYPRSCETNSFEVEYRYDDGVDSTGLLREVVEVGSGRVFWRAQARNAHNGLSVVEMDVLENGSIGLVRTYSSTPLNQLARISTRVGGANGQLTTDLEYTYTSSGRLQNTIDHLAGRTETFGYDPLDRLETWRAEIGPQNWTVTWDYDDEGTLTGRVLNGPGGGETITYRHEDPARPHLVTSSELGSYGHDWKGNRTQTRDLRIEYTPFDLPSAVRNTSGQVVQSYVYDADNTRFARKGGAANDTTFYNGGLYERRRNQTNVYHVVAEDGPVAQVECEDGSSERRVVYLEQDRQGSVIASLEVQRGSEVTVRRNEQARDPFGNTVNLDTPALMRPGAPRLPDIRTGYTGHEEDPELDLINMTGRIYDPKTARFLTSDPFASGLGSQSVNRLAYVKNDPTNLVDPSGFDERGCLAPPQPSITNPGSTVCPIAPLSLIPPPAPPPAPILYTPVTPLSSPPPFIGPTFQPGKDGSPSQSVAGVRTQHLNDTSKRRGGTGWDLVQSHQHPTDTSAIYEAIVGFGLPGPPLLDDVLRWGLKPVKWVWGKLREPVVGAGSRLRIGQAVAPIDKTLEMALNPNLYIAAVVQKYGINLTGSGRAVQVILNPKLVALGRVRAAAPNVIEIGPSALSSEANLANTIAHELNHARSFLRGGSAPESTAYSAGDALEDYSRGQR